MIKLTKVIVNGNRSLIGFVLRGKEKEFGGFSNNEIERSIPINNMIKDNFSNSQIQIVNNKIIEKGNFKINSLPMAVYMPDTEELIDIPNTVNINGRFVQNNENIGFEVQFADGSKDNLRYENVILLCKWFKPGNFAIRTSSKGKQYICSKSGGLKLDELPATVLGKESKAKRTKSAAKEMKPEFNSELESGFDIIDIYDFIKECNGCVIKFPSEKYTAATVGGETVVEGFTSLGIGEVASATPNFNATKLNVNADFKKVGIVPVNINGAVTNITTFVYRKKSVFLSGENYIKKFGIAVPADKDAALVNALGASLALEKITDPSVTSPLGQVIDAKSLAFYRVDSSKIDLLSENKRSKSVMSSTKLVTLCKKWFELKLISKAMGPKGGLMKNIKNAIGDAEIAKAKGKKPFGIFSMMNQESLDALTAAGIDIYTGAYTVASTPYASVKSGGDGADASEAVEIEYVLKGYDHTKLTGSKILGFAKDKDATKLPANVITEINKITEIADLAEQYNEANKLYLKAEKALGELSKKLWLHNASMYLDGNKARIHTHDSKYWVPDANTRVKKGKVYMCTAKGAEGLTIKFNGVEI